ncbi:hypothetical protein PFISCL1PPCAC_12858, partial [Pristionchus fissidentatus]
DINIIRLGDDILLFCADIVRDQFLGYFASQLGALSFERFVATHYWKWYEQRTPGTFTVLIVAELIADLPSMINVLLCEYGYYDHFVNFLIFGVIVGFSLMVFVRSRVGK